MPLLLLNFDDESLKVPLNGKILIGSDGDSDVCIDNSRVSPRHAEISAGVDGECRIVDLGSAHGTFVNGHRVRFPRRLEPGDELRFGQVNARFMGLQSPSLQPAPPETDSEPHPSDVSTPVKPKAEPKPSKRRTDPKYRGARPEKQAGPAMAPVDPKPDDSRASAPAVRPAPAPDLGANRRRTDHLMRLFIVLALVNAMLFLACAAWFFSKTKGDLMDRLATHASTEHASAPAAPTVPSPSAADIKSAAETSDLRKQVEGLGRLLEDLQKKISVTEERSGETTRQVAGISTTLEEIKKSASKKDAAPVLPIPAEGSLPSSQAELILIKERNRLTAYADEAIATGAREPYERLWDAIEDPHLANLVHATRAEILRVQDCYINGQRVKFYGIQQHQIPVAEIFPDSAALAPAQLSDDQLIQVLGDLKQPWQTRVKAAWHLGQRRSTKVGDALVKAIKSDPMLDVVAEATFSFEQISGYHAKIFDVEPLEAWWKSYNETPPNPKAPQVKEAGDKSKAE